MIEVQSLQRQVRKKYTTINGCTHPPSLMQIIAILFMLAIITLQANIISIIAQISNAILTTTMVLSYVLLLLILYDYFKMVIIDPVDPRLVEQSFKQHVRDKNLLIRCNSCGVDVHKYSYHCKRCNRCVQQFDHHCKYVNNCIGRQNYMHFFRILMSLILYLILQIGQGIWVLIKSDQNRRWIGLALAVIAGFVLPSLVYLAIFHCYISFFQYGTTLRYLKGEYMVDNSKNEARPTQTNQIIITTQDRKDGRGEQNLIEIPQMDGVQSATNLRRQAYYLF